MLLLMLLSFLGQEPRGAPATNREADDRSIIEASLADPGLLARTDCGRFDLFQKTHLAAMTYVKPPFNLIQLDRDRSVVTLPAELIESVRVRNQRPVSLTKVAKPRTGPCSATQPANPWKSVSVSRPGVSVDGLKAVVVILGTEGDCRSRSGCAHGGYNAYLERQNGTWHVVGRGGLWIE